MDAHTITRLKGYLPKGAVLKTAEKASVALPHTDLQKSVYELIYSYKGETYRAHVGIAGSKPE